MKFSDSFWGQFFKEKLKEVAQEAIVHLKNRPPGAVTGTAQQTYTPPRQENNGPMLKTALVRDGFFENSYIATSQVSYNTDLEGYKAGRLVYFVISGQGRNVGIYCNSNLYFDTQDEYVWPIIQELENIYSDQNYNKRIGQDEWREHPRHELIGKPNNPYTDQTDWQRIPGHFKYIEARHPSFEAPYDQLQLTSPDAPQQNYQEPNVEIEQPPGETIIDVVPEEPVKQEPPDYTQVVLKPLSPLPDYSKQKQKPILEEPPIQSHEPSIDTTTSNPDDNDDDDSGRDTF